MVSPALVNSGESNTVNENFLFPETVTDTF